MPIANFVAVRLNKVYLAGFNRSLRFEQDFDIGRFTVLFGKNNVGKTSLLENIYMMLATELPGEGEAHVRKINGVNVIPSPSQTIGPPVGAVYIVL